MHINLRLLLIAASLAANIVVVRRIRKARLCIDDAVFWVVFSLLILLLAVFPEIIYILSDLTGTKSPANLLYLLIISILITKIFFMSIRISVLDTKLRRLAQEMAIEKREAEEKEDKKEKEEKKEKKDKGEGERGKGGAKKEVLPSTEADRKVDE